MLNICHVTSAHTRYDIRIFIKECLALSKANYTVSLIVADTLNDELKDQVAIYSVGKESSRFRRMVLTPKKIYNKILELNPDVVHFHDPELMLIAKKLIKRGFKVIYDVHEDLPKQVQSKYWIPTFIRPLISKSVKLLERMVAKKLTAIVAATPIIAKRFKKYNSNTITLCNYPILAELSTIDVKWTARQNSICYIGSISVTRGIVPVVLSLNESKLPLQLAGSFSGDISKEKILNLSGGEYVNYCGVLGRAAIISLLSQVKIGVVTLLPTPSYIESLPIKMFEYMLSGIPVIASDFPLWCEIINKYKCGILVNPNDPKEIANACNYLMNHQDEARQMGENGKVAILKHFNWEVESKKLLKLYALFNG